MNPVFKIRNVTKAFGRHVVLDRVSLEVKPGEIIGMIGSSGSGKTTLLNVIIGFLKPERGDVVFSDHLYTKKKPRYRNVQSIHTRLKRFYGFASQIPSFYGELTVKENLEYFGALYDLTAGSIALNVKTLLKLMNLYEFRNLPAKQLSGGMERRLDIACALIHDPSVLFLDEPTADLDPVLRNQIWELIRKINKRGTTIILASHHLNELERLCSRVAILREGRIVDIGSPSAIKGKYHQHKTILIETYPGDYSQVQRFKQEGVQDMSEQDGRLVINTRTPEIVLKNLLKHLDNLDETIIDLQVETASLDEIFVRLAEQLR